MQYLENLEYSTAVVVNLGVATRPPESASMVLIPRDIEPDLPVSRWGTTWPRGACRPEVGTYAGLVGFHAHTDPRSRVQLAATTTPGPA